MSTNRGKNQNRARRKGPKADGETKDLDESDASDTQDDMTAASGQKKKKKKKDNKQKTQPDSGPSDVADRITQPIVDPDVQPAVSQSSGGDEDSTFPLPIPETKATPQSPTDSATSDAKNVFDSAQANLDASDEKTTVPSQLPDDSLGDQDDHDAGVANSAHQGSVKKRRLKFSFKKINASAFELPMHSTYKGSDVSITSLQPCYGLKIDSALDKSYTLDMSKALSLRGTGKFTPDLRDLFLSGAIGIEELQLLARITGGRLFDDDLLINPNEVRIAPVFDSASKLIDDLNKNDLAWRMLQANRNDPKLKDVIALGNVPLDAKSSPLVLFAYASVPAIEQLREMREIIYADDLLTFPLLYPASSHLDALLAKGALVSYAERKYDQMFSEDGNSLSLYVNPKLQVHYGSVRGVFAHTINRSMNEICELLLHYLMFMDVDLYSAFVSDSAMAFTVTTDPTPAESNAPISSVSLQGWYSQLQPALGAEFLTLSASIGVAANFAFMFPDLDTWTSEKLAIPPFLISIFCCLHLFRPVEIANALPVVKFLFTQGGFVTQANETAFAHALDFPSLAALRTVCDPSMSGTPRNSTTELQAAAWTALVYISDPVRWNAVSVDSSFGLANHTKQIYVPSESFDLFTTQQLIVNATLRNQVFASTYEPFLTRSAFTPTPFSALLIRLVHAFGALTKTSTNARAPERYKWNDGRARIMVGMWRLINAQANSPGWRPGGMQSSTTNVHTRIVPIHGAASAILHGVLESDEIMKMSGAGWYDPIEKLTKHFNQSFVSEIDIGNEGPGKYSFDYTLLVMWMNEFAFEGAGSIFRRDRGEDEIFAIALGSLESALSIDLDPVDIKNAFSIFHYLILQYVENRDVTICTVPLNFPLNAGHFDLKNIGLTIDGVNILRAMSTGPDAPLVDWMEIAASTGPISVPPTNLFDKKQAGVGEFSVRGDLAPVPFNRLAEIGYIYRGYSLTANMRAPRRDDSAVDSVIVFPPITTHTRTKHLSFRWSSSILDESQANFDSLQLRMLTLFTTTQYQMAANIIAVERNNGTVLYRFDVATLASVRFREQHGRKEYYISNQGVASICYAKDDGSATDIKTIRYPLLHDQKPKFDGLLSVCEYESAAESPKYVAIQDYNVGQVLSHSLRTARDFSSFARVADTQLSQQLEIKRSNCNATKEVVKFSIRPFLMSAQKLVFEHGDLTLSPQVSVIQS